MPSESEHHRYNQRFRKFFHITVVLTVGLQEEKGISYDRPRFWPRNLVTHTFETVRRRQKFVQPYQKRYYYKKAEERHIELRA